MKTSANKPASGEGAGGHPDATLAFVGTGIAAAVVAALLDVARLYSITLIVDARSAVPFLQPLQYVVTALGLFVAWIASMMYYRELRRQSCRRGAPRLWLCAVLGGLVVTGVIAVPDAPLTLLNYYAVYGGRRNSALRHGRAELGSNVVSRRAVSR